jgi:cobalt-zinc-cadmium resistance protein CzcA
MIDKIIELSVRNRLAVLIGIAVLIIWEIFSLQKLPLDAVSDITITKIDFN